jgi:Tol biopolymer transport system component
VSDARGNSDLYLLRVGGRNAVLLTADSPADDYAPAFSRDGNRVAFRSERSGGGIYVMEATGESVRRVTDFGYDPHWAPDGNLLVVADEAVVDPTSRTSAQSKLWVVNIADGTRRTVSTGDAVSGRWSPDGRRIAYWGRDIGTFNRDLYIVASDGSQADKPVRVTDDAPVDWSPAWAPDGRFLYFASNRGGTMNLWRIAIEPASGTPIGEPQGLTTPTAWSGWFELTADGRNVVFGDMDDRTTIWASAFDPVRGETVGRPRVVLQGLAINSINISPDGQKIVFSQRGQPWEALGTIGVDGSGWSRLTDDDVFHRIPSWSPTDDRVVFYRSNALTTIRGDGSGLTEIAVPAELNPGFYPTWSPDGGRLAIAGNRFGGVIDVSVSPARVVVVEPFEERVIGFLPHSWSPDGRWIAGTNRFNVIRDQVVIRDAQLKSPRMVASPGKSPVWLPDSRRLLYSSPSGIVLLDVASGKETTVVALTRTELLWGRIVSLSRDGRTLVYLGSQSEGDVWLMKIEEK